MGEIPVWATIALATLTAVILGGGIAADIILLRRFLGHPFYWRRRALRVTARQWTQNDAWVILTILGFLHLGLYWAVAFFRRANPNGGEGPPPWALITQSVVFHGAGLMLLIVLAKVRRLSWEKAFGLYRRNLRRDVKLGVFCYLAAMPLFAGFVLAYRILLNALRLSTGPQDILILFRTPYYPFWVKVYLATLALTVAPVVEELLFRGVALPVVARNLGPATAIFAVSALFAGIHFNLGAFGPLFVVALSFSVAYFCSGSIVVPAVMHASFNGVNLLVLYLATSAGLGLGV
ncbi:MAG: CPBP family intramembrane metalloprotease [Kiritimatiellae bacterium]|nr:CPBP family intramembrane metalloprotease [Kiritimatiellia bacterium]